MQRVHFIAIGGSAMHNLAIAISKKNNSLVTGSDDNILEPSFSRLAQLNLLPEEMGWFPERIHKGLAAVVVGMNTKMDNPELKRAKELGLKIYSFPEYVYQQTRSKTRIVVGGSNGKTTTAAMILFVLKKLKINADYILGSQITNFENLIKLSYEARIAVIEGDENLISPLDLLPKFHVYKPHIAVLTGISWTKSELFPAVENYIENFKQFTELMEVQGRLIYYANDEHLNTISKNLRRDIVSFPYETPEHEVKDGVVYLKLKKSELALRISNEHDLQNLSAARLACRQIGVYDDQFYQAIVDFNGISDDSKLGIIDRKVIKK